MELKIRISPSMASTTSPLGSLEDRLIRMPKAIREQVNLTSGNFIKLPGISADVHLQVARCYEKDALEDESCVYVSDGTYSRLRIKSMPSVKAASDVLIGCDPEFFLLNSMNNRLISASSFFSHYGDIGSDCGLAELRPRPSTNSLEVTVNIMDLLKQTAHHVETRSKKLLRFGSVSMVAASYRDNRAAGFHVHFGLPTLLLRDEPSYKQQLKNIVHILDYYVGIPSIIPEGEEDSKRRCNKTSSYGTPGDFRSDMMTLEYRVPGGHLLRHPVLTNGLLSISRVVMKDILSRIKSYTNEFSRPFNTGNYEDLRKLYPKLPNRESVFNAVVNEHTSVALSYVDKIFGDIQKMIGFDASSRYITDYFSYVLKLVRKEEKYSEFLVPNWRLSNER